MIEQNKCSEFLRAGCGLRAGPRVGSIKIAGRGPGREQYLLKLRAAGRAAVTKFRPACNSDPNTVEPAITATIYCGHSSHQD